MKTMKTAKKFPVHDRLMKVAQAEVKRHIVNYDGEKCFNIHTYLQSLESQLDGLLNCGELPTGSFELNAHSVARYLWVCLTLAEGQQTYGDTFRGMPMLD